MSDTLLTREAAPAPKASLASRLFGYDVFISFALGLPPRGSQSYASDLARRLREQDLSVFFSEDELPPGEHLSDTLTRALLRSKLLVVIVNRGTLELPKWVRTEVETYRAARPERPIIPICLDGCFGDPVLSSTANEWLKHANNIWLDERRESVARGLATDELVTRLLLAPRRIRANTLWRGLVAAVGLGLALLAAVAGWQAVAAMRERDRVSALRDQALSRQLAAQSTASIVRDPVRALLLAVQSQAIARTPASEGALLNAIASLPVARLQQHSAGLQAVAVSPRGDALVLSDVQGAVYQGELGKPALKNLVPAKPGLASLYSTVMALAFAPDGVTWAHAGFSRTITVHSSNGTRSFPDGDRIGESTPSSVLGLAFNPNGTQLAAVSTSRTLRLHGVADDSSQALLHALVDLASVAYSPDGTWIAVGGDQAFLTAIAATPGATTPKLATQGIGTINGLAFDAAGKWLFVASRGGRIEVFDAHDGTRLTFMDASEQGTIETMAVSPDGRFIATGHGNGAVLLWTWGLDPQPWRRQTLLSHAGAVRGLAFAADSRTLATVGADGRLFVSLPVDRGRWQFHPGPVPAQQPAQAPEQRGVRSPDGQWIVWPGTAAPAPAPFQLNLSGLAPRDGPRLTFVRGKDRQVLLDGAELPGEMGEAVVAGPVFSPDSARLAVQLEARSKSDANGAVDLRDRLSFWDLGAALSVDGSVPLPSGATLIGATDDGSGWIASVPLQKAGFYAFDADMRHWATIACDLAGRRLTQEEWRRFVGESTPYKTACD